MVFAKIKVRIILMMGMLLNYTQATSGVVCKYCDGLSGRSCLDVLSIVIGHEETSQRVQSLESAFAGSDRCTGESDITSCLERYESMLLSTGRGARLTRLRSACIRGGLGDYAVNDLLLNLNKVTGLGGWSLGASGLETVTCNACSGSNSNEDVMNCIFEIFFQTDTHNTKAIAISNQAEFALPAFIAACAAMERGDNFFTQELDPDAPLADSCTICDHQMQINRDEEQCISTIKAKLDNALTEDALTVYELAFAGASDQCKLGTSAKECVNELSHLLFQALNDNDKCDALRRACRAALHTRILSVDRDALEWTNLLLSPPIISTQNKKHNLKQHHRDIWQKIFSHTASSRCRPRHLCQSRTDSTSINGPFIFILFFAFTVLFLLWHKHKHRSGYSRLPNKPPLDEEENTHLDDANVVLVDSRNFRRAAATTTTTAVAIPMYRL